MKKLIACALFGLGLTQFLVACSDDDDGGDNTAGTAGAAAGSDTGGKGGGGSGQDGGAAGAGIGGSAGSAGKGGGGSSGSAQGGDGSAGEPTSVGGDSAGGSDGGGGDGAIGGDGAGGAGGAPPEVQTPTPRWLEKYCDAKAADTLACEGSPGWYDCFSGLFGFLSGEGGDGSGVCDNDDENFTKTLAMISAMDALAAACPKPRKEDWRCNAEGLPEPLIKACREAEAARVDAYKACFP